MPCVVYQLGSALYLTSFDKVENSLYCLTALETRSDTILPRVVCAKHLSLVSNRVRFARLTLGSGEG